MRAMTYQLASDTFTLAQLAIPKVTEPYDVLIKVHAVALNPVDAKVNFWHSMATNMNDNFVGGLDVSGEVVALGDKVTEWKVGDKVLYHGNMRREHGGFAEYALQDARTLVPHPNTKPEIAAASPCAAWTAYRALVDKLDIKNKQSLFIAGGAGGVGSYALQLAKHFGVKTIITTASSGKHNYVKQLGATHVIDYHQQDVIEQVMAITNNQGVDAALDCVGGDNDVLCASVLGYEGEMVELVKTVEPSRYPNAFLKGLSFHQLSLGSGHVNGEKGRIGIVNAGQAVSQLIEQGVLKLPQLEIINLEQIGEKLLELREQRTQGKVVASINTHSAI